MNEPMWLLCLTLNSMTTPAHAAARVQEVTGYLDAQDALIYELSGLRKGETLSVYAESTSGNLDPTAGGTKTRGRRGYSARAFSHRAG
jgi:hypothetical protein